MSAKRGRGAVKLRRGGRLLLLIGLLLLPVLSAAQSDPPFSVSHPSHVTPGEVLSLEVTTEIPLRSVTGMLLDGDTALVDNYGALLEEGEGRQHWVVLLGVASTIRPGSYQLRVYGAPGGSSYRSSVHVGPRSFANEEIPLSVTITDLRRSQDPRKREQALEMIALTNRFNRDATFWVGNFAMPVESTRRTSRFGDRRRFIYADGAEARSIHNGVDLAAPTGTPVYAPGGGRVVFAEERIVTGNSVVIEHFPGVYGLFYHLDTIDVSEGELLERGEPIGTVGSTGVSTGPHLHWELRVGGVSVDPGPFLEIPLVDTEGGIGALSE
jgi:murein DD-endopeptidase MepM/ murein hydrolase activator NlpD